jgi:hypothetical protein
MRAAWWSLLAFAPFALHAQPIVVRVYAYAPAPADAAAAGEEIFRRAGVDTHWTTCTPSRGDCGELHEGEILLKVVRKPWKTGPQRSSFGAAVVDDHSYLGWVFLDRIEEVARTNAARTATVLSHVMAHEVAHLLGLKHAERGIMRAEYDGAEVHSAETGALQFTDEEAAELRAGAIRRRSQSIASTISPLNRQP